jgi:hypothetical protein
MNDNENTNIETIAETENYVAWTDTDENGETVYHLELSTVTVHFFKEDWDELLGLMDEVIAKSGGSRGNGNKPTGGKPLNKR